MTKEQLNGVNNATSGSSFCRFPLVFVKKGGNIKISSDAKILYSFLLDRMKLSAKNGWFDEQGRVYVICTIEEAADRLDISARKAVQVINELDRCGLIERRRRGQGKPNYIYVRDLFKLVRDVNAIAGEAKELSLIQNQVKNNMRLSTKNLENKRKSDSINERCESERSRDDRSAPKEMHYLRANKSELIDNDPNNRIVSYPTIVGNTSNTKNKGTSDTMRCDTMTRAVSQEEYDLAVLEVQQLIDYRLLIEYDYVLQDELDEIVDVIAEVFCSKKKTIRISGQEHTVGKICKRLRSLTSEHILYVCESMSNTTTEIKNIRKYLLAALYNAPVSISSYYGAKVRSDFAKKNNDAP